MISHYNLVSFVVEATPCFEVDNTTRQLQVRDSVILTLVVLIDVVLGLQVTIRRHRGRDIWHALCRRSAVHGLCVGHSY
jgi:hypothetical protein